MWDTGTDLDALITVEVLFVTPLDETEETVQIANIQFNNLDIIGECYGWPQMGTLNVVSM